MTKQKVFLIRAEIGRSGKVAEAVMRLPVDKYHGLTQKGMELVRKRFFDGTTQMEGSLKYSLCLEAFTNSDSLMQALENYKKNII